MASRNQYLVWHLTILLTSCLISNGRAATEAESIKNYIVAIVNDEPITATELDTILAQVLPSVIQVTPPEKRDAVLKEQRKKLLWTLIDNKLVLQAARKQGITVAEKEVDEYLAKVPKRVLDPDDEKAVAEYRKKVRDWLLQERVKTRAFFTAPLIRPSELKKYYEEHPDDFVEKEERRVRMIFVNPTRFDGDRQKTRERAEQLLARLRKGEEFAFLAKTESDGPFRKDGGDWGMRPKGELLKELDEVAFQLKVGETSSVVESEKGFHLMKIEASKQERKVSFEEAQGTIIREVQKRAFAKAAAEWILGLRKNAYIVIF